MKFNYIGKPKKNILDFPLLAFAGILVLSTLFSSDRPASVFGSHGIWYDGALVFFFFFLLTRIMAENISLPKRIPFLDHESVFAQGLVRWIILSLPILFLACSLFFWNDAVFSYGLGFRVVADTIFDNPKNFFFGSGLATFSIDQHIYGFPASRIPLAGDLAATLGILGVFLLAILCGVLLYGSLILFQKRKEKTLPSLLFGMTGVSVLASLILPQSFFLFLFFWSTLFLGMMLLKSEKRYQFSPAIEKFGMPILLLVCMASMLIGFVAVSRGEWLYRTAMRSSGSARISYLQKAVRIHPFEAIYHIDLSRAYLNQFLQESLKPSSVRDNNVLTESLTLATASARTGISLSPNRSISWEQLGSIYKEAQFVEGAQEWAIQSFEKAVSLNPLNSKVQTELGVLYSQKEDLESARKHLEKAITLDPFSTNARMEMSLLLEKEGKTNEAILMMENVARTSSEELPLVQLGRMYYNVKKYSQAIMQFEKAVALDSANSNARYALALSYEAIGEKENAIQELRKVLQLNPENEDIQHKINSLQQKTN